MPSSDTADIRRGVRGELLGVTKDVGAVKAEAPESREVRRRNFII
jgi:hypothetical protein